MRVSCQGSWYAKTKSINLDLYANFDSSFKQLRFDKKEELKIVKGVYETEVKGEDTALDDARVRVRNYNAVLIN